MKVLKQPRYSWEDVVFVCGTCGAEVQMESSDYGNKNNRFRHTMTEGWTVRAHCQACQHATARFRERREE